MDNFNLIDSPWIPVRWRHEASGDTVSLVSLHDAFHRSAEIADLDCAPHKRISLTRLLVCITHAALGAPKDEDEWDAFGKDFAATICAYLRRPDIHPHFNLLSDGLRFLQMKNKGAKADEGYPLCKLFFQLASGNSPKLLDHWGEDPRPWAPADAALGLLCLQNFFVGGSMASKVKGNGPSLKSLQMLLVGNTLEETILRNCIDLETLEQTGKGLGRPVWEAEPDHQLLARLAPVPCALWLSDDLATTLIDQGYRYLEYEAYRDPFTTTYLFKKEDRRLLRANLEKGIWRDLNLITNLEHTKGTSGPLNLQSFKSRNNPGEWTQLWAGELIKPDKKAIIIDCTESTFTVPKKLFLESGKDTYQSGVNYAEKVSKALYGAIKRYWSTLKHETAPVAEGQKHYWHRLDQEHRTLILLASDPESFIGKPAIGEAEAKDSWTELVRKAALNAFSRVCPRTTPRQYQAYANGIKPLFGTLYPKDKENKRPSKTSKETTQTEMSR